MTQPVRRQPFTATITGSPRIGPRRELKRATEGYWAGRTSRSELEAVAATLRRDTWSALAAAGLDSVPVNTFSYYDQMLDTAVLLGALPPRVSPVSDGLDRYFAAARGTDQIAPLEMTKWFDTNYHYLVPEIGPSTTFTLHPGKVLAELKEALGQGIPARPVIIGPITFLLLSKAVDGAGAPIERLEELVPVYSELLSLLADGGAQWVQFDEPALVTDLSPDAPALAEAVYTALCSVSNRPAIYVATYFGDPCAASEVARTVGSVAKSMGDYLDSHPETNQVMTAVLQQQVGPGSVASLKAHFEANPKVASDLHALSQPLTDLSTRCSLPISGLQAIGLMQAVQGARR